MFETMVVVALGSIFVALIVLLAMAVKNLEASRSGCNFNCDCCEDSDCCEDPDDIVANFYSVVEAQISFADAEAKKALILGIMPHVDHELRLLDEAEGQDPLDVRVNSVVHHAFTTGKPEWVECYTELKVGEFRERLLGAGWTIDAPE